MALVGGAAAAWPLPLDAQPPALPVVGVLLGGSTEADTFRVEAFRQGLKETGYVEGQNVILEYRFAEDNYARLPGLAADLVQRQASVLAAIGNAAANTSAPTSKSMSS
jgi:putative tryptophan/tyrosine transport system substrate-binding protein